MDSIDFLAEASCLLTDARQQQYGSFKDNHERIAILWSEFLGCDITSEQVAICMALVKISRIANDSSHKDNYIDAISYLAGAGELASK